MFITINGKSEEIGIRSSINELILAKGLRPEHVVVEHNLRIVPKLEWQDTFLEENDSIEIISFVGGG
ncbi:MAG: sulfur carrier protein ThiS [Candidatus Omnitrophica bacterium]|nr:sulfur carrier protein ThiS [Candidatus Omnitrophota bacterium]